MSRVPEQVRLVAVATLGASIGWLTYELIYWLNPLVGAWRATSSWTPAFAIGVARQHALHRWLTFRTTDAYWPSLGRAYRYYALIAATGAGLNYTLTMLGVPHRIAWLACLAVTATCGLLFLRKHVFS